MSLITEFLSLFKSDDNTNYDQETMLNGNWDKIDAKAKTQSEQIENLSATVDIAIDWGAKIIIGADTFAKYRNGIVGIGFAIGQQVVGAEILATVPIDFRPSYNVRGSIQDANGMSINIVVKTDGTITQGSSFTYDFTSGWVGEVSYILD